MTYASKAVLDPFSCFSSNDFLIWVSQAKHYITAIMQEHETGDIWQYTGQSEKVPETVQHVKIGSHVPRIPNEAFFQHVTLEDVTFSSSSS
eukprot:scaffold3012_cov112-Cylindrotheca_fusiformis.AAC.1